jgi:hypothetical protein
MQKRWRQAVNGTVGHHSHLESNSLGDPQPLKRNEGVGDVFRPSNIEDQASGGVLHRMKTTGARGRKSVKGRTAIVHSRQLHCNDVTNDCMTNDGTYRWTARSWRMQCGKTPRGGVTAHA